MAQYKAGESGNPNGRPKGAGNKNREANREFDAHMLPEIRRIFDSTLDEELKVKIYFQNKQYAYPKLAASVDSHGDDIPQQPTQALASFDFRLLTQEAQHEVIDQIKQTGSTALNFAGLSPATLNQIFEQHAKS